MTAMAAKAKVRSVEAGPRVYVEWLASHAAPSGVVTDAELARRVGVSQSMLMRYKSGATMPSFDVIRRGCNSLNLPILVGLVKAGLMSEDEAEVKVFEPTLDEVPSDDMLAELKRRLDLLPSAI